MSRKRVFKVTVEEEGVSKPREKSDAEKQKEWEEKRNRDMIEGRAITSGSERDKPKATGGWDNDCRPI